MDRGYKSDIQKRDFESALETRESREMRVEGLEALRLREGNRLSGVGSKDSSWPWLGEVEN